MEKGRIVYLNGVTSAGKTSIVEALQALSFRASGFIRRVFTRWVFMRKRD